MNHPISQNKKTIWLLLAAAFVIVIAPLIFLRGAEFGGSDDAGSQMIAELQGGEYEPWFTPVAETFLQRELPGEVESLLFCVQTGIGVFVIAFFLGRFVERKKWMERYGAEEPKDKESVFETEMPEVKKK